MNGVLLWVLVFLIYSCGNQRQIPYDQAIPKDKPDKIPDDPIDDGGKTFGDIQPLLIKYCGECHSDAVFIGTQKGFLSSKAPDRLNNKSMPPAYAKTFNTWTESNRTTLLDFIKANK